MKRNEIKQLMQFVKEQAGKAQADLDNRMATVPKVCGKGCDACCYQMVSVHTWEEGLIGSYIETKMHAQIKKQVRAQLIEWWGEFLSRIRPVNKANPLTIYEYQALTYKMIQDRVMCPFLVEKECSIYPVRPAVCRAYVVSANAERCVSEPGRKGEEQGKINFLETFGSKSQNLPVDRYPHSFKPLAFAVTGIFRVPAPSTPTQGIMIGDLP